MSYLSLPRIHFCGRLAVSTPTANNNNYDLVLDPENVDQFDPYKSMTDEAFRLLMRQLVVKDLSFMHMGDQEVLNANWDYDGDNSLWVEDVVVTAVDGPDGRRLTTQAEDPLVGLPIDVLGDSFGDGTRPAIIVDNDPTSDLTSQVFLAKFALGGDALGLTAASNPSGYLPRTYSRWLYITRNLGVFPDACFSAIWQLALPKANLTFAGAERSPTLAALAKQAAPAIGLQARFCTYYFERKYTDQELQDFFKNGKYPPNRSRGIILGTIGQWNEGELGTAPSGRILYPPITPMDYPLGKMTTKFTLGPAAAQVDAERGVVTLDLITAFPEMNEAPDSSNVKPEQLIKMDLGTATLQVVSADGKTTTTIGTVPYDTATYVAGAGLVELPITTAQQALAATGLLQITADKATVSPVLLERAVTAETDDRAVYLAVGETTSILLRVFERGGAPTGPIAVSVQQYRAKEVLGDTKSPMPGLPMKQYILAPDDVKPFVALDPAAAMVGADGTLTLQMTGLEPGLGMLRFLTGPASENFPPPLNVLDQQSWFRYFVCNVRVLPNDAELDAIPDAQVTWELVYDKVLRYYYRMYPTMDLHMRLNDKDALATRANMIQMMIDASAWPSTLYMPVTRELSNGKRRLLQRWCARVLAGVAT